MSGLMQLLKVKFIPANKRSFGLTLNATLLSTNNHIHGLIILVPAPFSSDYLRVRVGPSLSALLTIKSSA